MRLKLPLLSLCLIVVSSHLISQSLPSSPNQNLDTLKIQSPTNTTPDTCCPHIIQYHDQNKILLQEITTCNGFEWIKDYYPNGNLKMCRQFKEYKDFTKGFKENPFNSSIRDGIWSYFNENGDTLYNEFWQDGFFIKQVPEQLKTEIWDAELIFDADHYSGMLSFEQLRTLEIVLLYKNSHRDSVNIKVQFEIISPDQKHFVHTYTPDNFKKINVKKLLKKDGIPPVDYSMSEEAIDLYPGDIDTRYRIKILNNGILIADREIYLYP